MRLPRPSLSAALLAAALGLAVGPAVLIVEAAADPQADPLDPVQTTVTAVTWAGAPLALALASVAIVAMLTAAASPGPRWREAATLAIAAIAGCSVPVALLGSGARLEAGAWLTTFAALLCGCSALSALTDVGGSARRILVPALLGMGVVYAWEVLVRGLDVPPVLLPPPSVVAAALVGRGDVLAADFVQTVLHAALVGYLVGCATGFALALACDRHPYLARGLLPYGNLASAIPMVGLAPIMIMWFGFDWPSKAAVVVVATTFPMLVNTLAGLAASERIQIDLMRSYAAGHWRALALVRLPNAMPFIFNALKINSTFALISAIVAEFFGSPIAGMGFRISTEVARMDLDVVWATIAVASVVGAATYGGLALLERAVTSWHPSYREVRQQEPTRRTAS